MRIVFRSPVRSFGVLFLLLAFGAITYLAGADTPEPNSLRPKAQKLMQDGNWKDAYDQFRAICLAPTADPKLVGQDLANGVQCLRRLGRTDEVDEFLESTIKVHGGNWRLLSAAAQQYLRIDHQGFMIAGKYSRGPHRGGGQVTNSLERDRVRALQLMQQALPLVVKDDNKPEVGQFFLTLGEQFMYGRGYQEAWRLQYLSNLQELPDYDEGYPYYKPYGGAPVDADGKPVLYSVPKSWEAAQTDGERWRWCQAQAVENNPAMLNTVRWQQAQFYRSQFAPETMNQFSYGGGFFGLPVTDDDTKKDESGTYALHTLKENETIAKLATGIKRFELPDEFNYLKIYQAIVAEPKTGMAEQSCDQLAQCFENRRQYPTAATWWRQGIEKFGPGQNNRRKNQLEQIVGNWGRFEPRGTGPAGPGMNIDYRYRNAKKVSFTAHALKMDQLLNDVKAYLKSDPNKLNWQQTQIDNIGWRIVHQNETKYLGEKVAEWSLDLSPRPNHWDRRVTVSTPLQKAGAYLVTAKLDGGNETKIVLWLADTAIVQKPLDGKSLYYVADAVTGKPLPAANLEFFGFKVDQLGGNRFKVNTTNFAEKTDQDGLSIPDPRDLKPAFQWLVTARDGGHLAYLGFSGVWYNRWYDEEYNTVKMFCITDRPVYRPNQSVQFKIWIGNAKYDDEGLSKFAKRSFPVELYDPQGEKVQTFKLTTDEYGGLEGSWEIKSDAKLGQYFLQIPWNENKPMEIGGNNFRVEEYKKPEFEVSVEAPQEPVMLGEKIKAQIKAKYYFGAPVTKAKVKYTITRDSYSNDWYPAGVWDWCYGSGYWWFAYDYPWYPGWSDWCGCRRPLPWWWFQGRHQPPEMVAEQEVEIKPDGTIDVEIDTQIAKELHGDTDHQYSITAEVRDESRRTIVGSGNVLVARKPFKVFTWLNRGYYRVGETMAADFLAQTLDKKPVQGQGELTLYKIAYDKNRKPVETAVQKWPLNTNEEGRAQQQIQATTAGQYRLAYKVTDARQHTIEGGYVFTIGGEGNDDHDYRFSAVELIPEKREYQPGEKIKLQINTDRTDSTVLLFVRPANGVYLPPRVLRLTGKSTVQEIEVQKKDMPNFFVEAVTVAGANVFQESKEIVVPPEKRVLNVKVLPSETEYLPGQEAKVKVQLTDIHGENYVGSTVLSVYDKALEYISGGSNVPDIKEFFWKWRRHHNPNQQTSLAKSSQNMYLPHQPGMGNLGVFGATVVDETELADDLNSAADFGDGQSYAATSGRGIALGGGFGGAGGRAEMAMDAAAPEAAAAPMAKAGGLRQLGLAYSGALAMEKRADDGNGPAAGPALQEPTVRTNFADTAFWKATITTDKTGVAEVSFKMPENLSAWKMKVWALGNGSRVGSGDVEVVTRKNLILRMQTPRFFVQKDEVVLSANVHNYLKTDKEVTVKITVPEKLLQVQGEATVKVKVPAGGEQRVDWRVTVLDEGEAAVRMQALTDEESDAMEMKLPCYVHGMLKQEAWAGTIRPDKEAGKLTIHVPKERRVEQSVLEIRYSPTLAMAMVDALPYLADYPYGCTEQTLNRFLPTVVTQKVLREMKLDLAAIRDKRSNLNAQEIGDDKERAKQWKRFDRNPVFDDAELNRMAKEGLTALTNMQCSDGGWGWFSGYGERSWPHTTAVVVHGLQIARENDLALVPGMLDRGIDWLKRYQNEQVRLLKNAPNKVRPWKDKADALDAFVYMILVDEKVDNKEMREFLYRDRNDLPVYSKAMFGLAVQKQGDKEKLDMLLKNIEQYLVQDSENESAYLKLPENNSWWCWYGSETEANAYYLKLLARTDPKGEAAPRLVKYLLNNRKHATYWSSTRDTAICVEAFADYVRASGEQEPDMVVEVFVDGEKKKEVAIKADNLFTYDNKFVLTGADVKDGSHDIELRRKGKGPVYFNAYLTNFTLEDPITKAGLEIKVERKMYKLVPVKKEVKVEGVRGQALDQRVEKYERQLLADMATLKSGDLVEIELEFESKNDYEYIMFEDMKAAGFEPVEVRSGYSGNGLGAYMELRDNRVTFFVRALARGKNSIAYRMRAEIPGKFSALPAKAAAMYAPELKANSDEQKLKIEDQ